MRINIKKGKDGLYRPFMCRIPGEQDMMPCGRGFKELKSAVSFAQEIVDDINDNYEGIFDENGRWV